MGLATDAGEMLSCPLPMGEAAQKMYAAVIQTSPELANKDFSSVYAHLRDFSKIGRAGVEQDSRPASV